MERDDVATESRVENGTNRHNQYFSRRNLFPQRRSHTSLYEPETSHGRLAGTTGDRWAPDQENFGRNTSEQAIGFERDDPSPDVGTAVRKSRSSLHKDTEQCQSMAGSQSGHAREDKADWARDDAASTISRTDENTRQSRQLRFSDQIEKRKWYQSRIDEGQHSRVTRAMPIRPPPTAYDLRGYDYHVYVKYSRLPKQQRFFNGANGKVAPSRYGSEQRHDLGLCFTTFLTRHRCEMGLYCPWRHHPISEAERAWIVDYGRDRGRAFLDNVDRWWAVPELPLPGSNMEGLGDD